jgi:hypothetical protein
MPSQSELNFGLKGLGSLVCFTVANCITCSGRRSFTFLVDKVVFCVEEVGSCHVWTYGIDATAKISTKKYSFSSQSSTHFEDLDTFDGEFMDFL